MAFEVGRRNFVVLTPYSQFGDFLKILNNEYQKIYDVGNPFVIDNRKIKWMEGDRVMLTENDTEIGVFNGASSFGSRFITTIAVSCGAILVIVEGLTSDIQLTLGKIIVTVPDSPAPLLKMNNS